MSERRPERNAVRPSARRPRASLRKGSIGAVVAVLLLLLTASVSAQQGLFDRVLQPLLPGPPDPGRMSHQELDEAPAPTPPAAPVEEALPGPGERIQVPLSSVGTPGEVQYGEDGERISLIVRDASLSYVLALLAERRGLNIVASNDIDAVVSLSLYNKTVEEALSAILSVAGYTWTTHDGVIYVTPLSQGTTLPADLQGRRIQVFPLDYASGQALSEAVTGFLSPVGQVFVTTADPQNNRLTQEVLVVEDLPYALERIALFVEQMDQPPRQVLIEAHVLQVELQDDREHGVNFEYLFNTIGTQVSTLGTTGLAPTSPAPAFFAAVTEGHLKTLVQLLKTTTDAKTLASPRLLAVNEQTARMHVGEQIGYRQTTTTETSANEGAAFVEVGVILEITPRITRDNRILLHVRPEVSDGQINPDTQVPDTQKTELETNVLLDDGYGVVIGGLIKETDSVIQRKIPYLGDVYLVGKLFQHEQIIKERSEIIVVLIPRIYPYSCDYASYENGNMIRTETDLFEGPLMRKDRPWAPKLPDAVVNPRILHAPPIGKNFPYPARLVEMAATPQPQRDYPVPPRPGPAVQFAPGQGPLGPPAAPEAYVPGEEGVVISDDPITFGPSVPPAQPHPVPQTRDGSATEDDRGANRAIDLNEPRNRPRSASGLRTRRPPTHHIQPRASRHASDSRRTPAPH